MDIVEFTKRIHKLEVDHDFFNIKDQNGLIYWDVVRHDIFYAIYFELAQIKIATPKLHHDLKSRLNLLSKYAKNAFSIRYLKANNYTNLCFACSRYKNDQNENIDYALNDILKTLDQKDTLILETNLKFNDRYHYPSIFNCGIVLEFYLKRIKGLLRKRVAIDYTISNILKNEFKVTLDLDLLINQLVNKYTVEYFYYRKFFQKLNPKRIFIVQNGIQKGLIKAANELNIPLYEMQHGLVSFIHPAYHYSKTLSLDHLNTFPSCFLSFSTFWSKNINYPVKKIATVGNNFFAQKLTAKNQEFVCTIISADIYSINLNQLLEELLIDGFSGNIALKLHPNQSQEIDIIRGKFKNFSNVKVIYDELSIKELLQLSSSILAVQSTCVYEALDNNIKVLIYKIKDYKTHDDIFENPNVYQVSNFNEVNLCLQRKYIFEKENCFFETFEKSVFLDLLNN